MLRAVPHYRRLLNSIPDDKAEAIRAGELNWFMVWRFELCLIDCVVW